MPVYFIQDAQSGAIKIGTAKDVRRRLQMLQTGSASQLQAVAVIEGDATTEQELHHRFRFDRIHGEWFNPTPDLLSLVGQNRVEISTKRRGRQVELPAAASPVDHCVNLIREFAIRPGMSPSRLAQDAGLAPNTLRDCLKPSWNPRLKTIQVLEAHIRTVAPDLFEDGAQ